MFRRLILGALALASVACGSDSPTAPTPPAQLAGVWRGTLTETSVTGGECLGPLFLAGVGASAPVSVAFTQSGGNVSAIATLTNTGGNYTYTGSVGQSALTMNGSTCSICNVVGAACPGSTARRDLKIQTFALNGTVTGNTLTGTDSETYNVVPAGGTTPVGALTFNYSFTLTRQ